jgi:glycine/D-amino acid oxidase-like deaminating enzyme
MSTENSPWDVIVAGAGLAGVLTAVRLADARPGARILLIDRETAPGGRLRVGGTSGGTSPDRWGYGLNGLSKELYDFWDQTLKASPETEQDLAGLVNRRQSRVGILSGSSIAEVPLASLATPKGARVLGGMAAQKQWSEVESILSSDSVRVERSGASFADMWKLPRKSPATIVLEHYGAMFGIPDLWAASTTALAERIALHTGGLYAGNWDKAFELLLSREIAAGRIEFRGGTRIGDADREGELWTLTTDRGSFTSKTLVVAQPPWLASQWLPKEYWPTELLALVSKTKPVSVVVLTEKLLKPVPETLPEIVLIPAEGVQAVISCDSEIAFQATIDYEMTLQAPEVVKAVKRLKRARRKLANLHPDLMSDSNRIALVPVGWAQPPSHGEHRHVDKLGNVAKLQSKELGFCGDAYGASWNGDSNLIKSVLATCEAIG